MTSRGSLRSLLLPAAGCLAAVAIVAGCAGTTQPTWTEPPAAQALPGPVTAKVAVPAVTAVQAHAAALPVGGTAMAGMAGMAAAGGTTAGGAGTAAGAAPAGSAASAVHVELTIVTGDMIGRTEYPAFIPSDIVLPANSTVVVTVTNFDDATPLAKGTEQYARAQGIVGDTFTVTPIDPKSPNGSAGATATLSALDPNAVSHTLTAPGLGLNVPIAPHARVTFTIQTGAPGTYVWHCFDPCGAGATGWGTAMKAMSGYMEGTITVA